MRELEALVEDKVEIHIIRFAASYAHNWQVIFKKETEGVKLEVNVSLPTFEEAVGAALDKWSRISGGVKEFSGPLITLQPSPADLNDDIPF